MRPLTVIVGIVMGSCLAIAISLAAVALIWFLLGDEYPRVRQEFRPLLTNIFIFLGMTAISAASFYTLLINHKSALILQLALWSGLAATVYYYLPA